MDFNTFLERFELDPANFKPNSAELIEHEKGYIYYCEQETSHIPCPYCGSMSVHIHQYYTRKIRCSMNSFIEDLIIVKRPRYICKDCHKTFIKEIKGLKYRDQFSNMDNKLLVLEFCKNQTFKQIANNYHMSVRGIIYKFDEMYTEVSRKRMPRFLCIDEFHFTSVSDEKYCCVLSDFATGQVIDILKTRQKKYLDYYFQLIPKKERDNVEIFVSDMYKTYRYVRNRYFKKATHVIDKFHIIKQLTHATNSLRVSAMNRYYSKEDIHYNFMKTFWRLFLQHKSDVKVFVYRNKNSREAELSDQLIFECKMKDLSLCQAYDTLQELYHLKEYDTYQEAFDYIEYISNRLRNTCNDKLIEVADTYMNWQSGIANAYCRNKFGLNFHNGVAEGNNNLIKTILKNAYGYKSFDRFRKRALLILQQVKFR